MVTHIYDSTTLENEGGRLRGPQNVNYTLYLHEVYMNDSTKSMPYKLSENVQL